MLTFLTCLRILNGTLNVKKCRTVQKEEQITYTYEASPIYKEQYSNVVVEVLNSSEHTKCYYCKGKGTFVSSYDNKKHINFNM